MADNRRSSIELLLDTAAKINKVALLDLPLPLHVYTMITNVEKELDIVLEGQEN